nr:hypothetical protein GCM10025732_24040 [Glycomyces mayteni]
MGSGFFGGDGEVWEAAQLGCRAWGLVCLCAWAFAWYSRPGWLAGAGRFSGVGRLGCLRGWVRVPWVGV